MSDVVEGRKASTLDEWADSMKKETDESPERIDEFVVWWRAKHLAEPLVYRMDDEWDGDLLYDEAFFDWDEDGEVDMQHVRDLMADQRAGLTG